MNLMELALRFTQAAAHVLWAGALLALAVLVIERLFVRTAAGRHALHLTGMILLALSLPVAFAFTPATPPPPAPVLTGDASGLAMSSAPLGGESSPAVELTVPRTVRMRSGREMPEAAFAPSPAPATAQVTPVNWERIAPWAAGTYLAGLIAMLVRMSCGFAGTARLRRQSEPVEAGIWTAALQRMGDQIRLRARPALKWSREVAAPVIIGFVKPAILLPVALASRLSPAQVEAVLAHELAHLRRRDTWALAAQRLVETIVFFHPAMWWMSHRMVVAREEACDDLVLAAGCNPADYAEALVICSECRLERKAPSSRLAAGLSAAGHSRNHLRRRVLRLIGGGDDGAVRLGRTGWMLGLLLIGSVAMALAAGSAGRKDLADFNFDDPPSAFEKDIQVADRNQRFKADGLQFQASPLRWEKEGWLRLPIEKQGPGEELFLNLGVSDGYEVVEIRLFDHATRQLIHTSAWQYAGKHTKDFLVERIGSTNWLRMKETGGMFPDRIDVWLRIATSGSGKTIVLKAEDGASARLDGSEIVVTSLLEGAMNGKGSGPDGRMIWDLSSANSKDSMTTVNLENRGDLLQGRYHLVAITKDGVRHPMDHTHFHDFARSSRHAYFLMDVALNDLDHLELVPFKDRHKFFFNGLETLRKRLPELSRSDLGRIENWTSDFRNSGLSEQDFLTRVKRMGPQSVRGLVSLMNDGQTDRLAMKGIEQFLGDPAVAEYLAGVLRELGDDATNNSNTATCCLLLLGKSKDARYVDLIAPFLETSGNAAMNALAEIGGEKARDYLISAFDQVPSKEWWLVAERLEQLGDPAAAPELKRRLAMVTLPPDERFPARTISSFTKAIAALSEKDRISTTLIEWSQGVRFRYPYDGPGLPKSFSVDPQSEYYIRLPLVDAQTEAGRQAIWQAFEAGTEGAGFTIDGDEIVAFHGLRVMPLWKDGPPYPTTWYDWLDRTSQLKLLEQIEREGKAGRSAIPENGLLLGVDSRRHLHAIGLRKEAGDHQYSIWMKALDPLRLLVNAASSNEEPFVEWSFCTLHDLGSGAKGGGLNLNREQMVPLNENVRTNPGTDAILAADFQDDKVGWVVPGSGDFIMVPLNAEPSAGDLIAALRKAEQPSPPDHERVKTEKGTTHVFRNPRAGQLFGFAARMPGGVPVAGLIELRSVDRGAKTVDIRHRYLRTDGARAVFSTDVADNLHSDRGSDPDAQPLTMLDYTATNFNEQAWARLNAWDTVLEAVKDPLSDDPGYPISQRARTPQQWKDLEQTDHFLKRAAFSVWVADELMPAIERRGETLKQELTSRSYPSLPYDERTRLNLAVLNQFGLLEKVIDLTQKHLAGPARYAELAHYASEKLLVDSFDASIQAAQLFALVGEPAQMKKSVAAQQQSRDSLLSQFRERNARYIAERLGQLPQYRGRVMDAAGNGIAGAVLTFRAQASEQPLLGRVLSNTNGAFLLPSVEPGLAVSVAVQASGFASEPDRIISRRADGTFAKPVVELRREPGTASAEVGVRLADFDRLEIEIGPTIWAGKAKIVINPDGSGTFGTGTWVGKSAREGPWREIKLQLTPDQMKLLHAALVESQWFKVEPVKGPPPIDRPTYTFRLQQNGQSRQATTTDTDYTTPPYAQLIALADSFDSEARKRGVEAGIQSATQPGMAWGEPTDGVQVRLHSPRQMWSKDEFSIYFKTDLRSATEHVFPHYGPMNAEFFLELDGQWFELNNPQVSFASVGPSPATLREDLHTWITARHWRSMSTGKPMPDFASGRHTFRIGFPLSAKPDASGQRPRAVSNPVELEIIPRNDLVSITGNVIGVRGKPADVYRVRALPKQWSTSWGEMPVVMTGTDGTFTFRGLPDGPCDVSATPVPLTDLPNMRIEGVVLKKGEPVHVTLSLEEKYSFSGRFTDAAGAPQTNRNVLAIWKDPAGKNTYSSYAKTDADGRYRFKSPFEVAERILINDGNSSDNLERRNVRAGREDLDFQLSGAAAITAPTEQMSGFGNVVERSIGPDFNSGIDMDAGLVRTMDRGFQPQEVRLSELGADLWVSPIDSPPMPVHGLNLAAVRAADSDWNIAPSELVRRLDGVAAKASTLLLDEKAKYPATFLVRTREGGMGVLQILGPKNKAPTGWNVRYKMLPKAAAADAAGTNHPSTPPMGMREVVITLDAQRLLAMGLQLSNIVAALHQKGIQDAIGQAEFDVLQTMSVSRSGGAAVRLSDVARIEERRTDTLPIAGGMGPLTRVAPDGSSEILLMVTDGPTLASVSLAQSKVSTTGPTTSGESRAQTEAAWGEPVNGLSVRLRPGRRQITGEQQAEFQLDVLNSGNEAVPLERMFNGCFLEVDGQWYGALVYINGKVDPPIYLRPGETYSELETLKLVAGTNLNTPGLIWHGSFPGRDGKVPWPLPDAAQMKMHVLNLTPGKYTIRLAYNPTPNKVSYDQLAYSETVEVEVVSAQKPTGGSSAAPAGAQPESAWGEPVNGLSVRLRPERRLISVKQQAEFQLDVRNQSSANVQLGRMFEGCFLEVDGQWYGASVIMAGDLPPPVILKPGETHFALETLKLVAGTNLTSPGLLWHGSFPSPRPLPVAAQTNIHVLNLTPGKHIIRLAYNPTPDKAGDERLAYSNPVELEIMPEGAGGQDEAGSHHPDQERLKGEWEIVSMEGDGNHLWQMRTASDRIQIEKVSLRSFDGSDQSKILTYYAISPLKTPKEVDVTFWLDNLFVTQHGLYQLDGDKLTLCLAPYQDERPKQFAAVPGKSTLFVLKRIAATKTNSESGRVETGRGGEAEALWSQPVSGLQSRLRADRPSWMEGQTPTFRADIRNQGTGTYTVAQAQELCELELDGQRYRWVGDMDVKSSQLAPGREFTDIAISLTENWVKVDPGVAGRSESTSAKLKLLPGRHTLRIRFFCDGGSGRRSIVLESNAVEFEIQKANPGERGSLDGNWGAPVNGLQCRLLPASQTAAPSTGGRQDTSVYVTYELRNVSSKAVKFLEQYTPLQEVAASSSVFKVLDMEGKRVRFMAADRELVRPTSNHFVTIEPGQTISNRIAVPCDFTRTGSYRISSTQWHLDPGTLQAYYNDDSAKVAQNPDNVWTGKLESNEVEVKIVPASGARPGGADDSSWSKPANGLQCRLLPATQKAAPSTGLRDKTVFVTYELRNVSGKAVKFLPWYSPLEGVLSGGVFHVVDKEGKTPAYRGEFMQRMPPTAESFVTLEPGQTLTNRVGLPYDFSKPGFYRVTSTKSDTSASAMEFYHGNDAAKIAGNPDNVWTGKLESNEVQVEIVVPELKGAPTAAVRREHRSRQVATGRAIDSETGATVENFVIQDRLPMSPEYDGPPVFGGETRSAGGFRDGKFPIRASDTYENDKLVEAGHGECRLVADGYLPEHVVVPDDHPSGKVFIVRLRRGNMIRGRVLDHTGKPVIGAGIYLSNGQRVIELTEGPHSEFQAPVVRTDENGRFEMSGGGADNKSIFVTAPSLFVWRADLPQPGQEAAIRLPEPAKLRIHYDIKDAPAQAQVRIELRTWDMLKWQGAVNVERWVGLVAGKDGLLIENLPPGLYDISRIKHLRTATSGTDAMLDRNLELTLESGKTTEYNFVRLAGASISGEIVGLPDENVDGIFVYVKPVEASGDPQGTDWKLPTFDGLSLDGNGEFTTERIAPGRYKIVAAANRTETPEERGRLGLRLPAWIGSAIVTVPEAGDPPRVRVEMKPWSAGEN